MATAAVSALCCEYGAITEVDGTSDDVNLLGSLALTYFMHYWRETKQNRQNTNAVSD